MLCCRLFYYYLIAEQIKVIEWRWGWYGNEACKLCDYGRNFG